MMTWLLVLLSPEAEALHDEWQGPSYSEGLRSQDLEIVGLGLWCSEQIPSAYNTCTENLSVACSLGIKRIGLELVQKK